MSWRSTQLGNQLCDQDQLILNLFRGKSVNYVGTDHEFKQHLIQDPMSKNLVLILNQPIWISDIITTCKQHLTEQIESVYIGINRYHIQGNDTNKIIKSTSNHGSDLIDLVTELAGQQGFLITKSGKFDNDLGRYFNFVQPLTWVYGHNSSNKS